MDFARGLLEKYGWTEGKGLGKNESGISEALKPSLKFDTTGIGHDHSDQFTFKWWEIAFNDAANRIEVQKSDSGGAVIRTDVTKKLHFSTNKPWTEKLKKENALEYGSFVKTEKLTGGGELVSLKDKDTTDIPIDPIPALSDEELFRICGGRTAHKAARHGHKLVGKLARVMEQEKKLISERSPVAASENEVDDRPIKKKKKRKKVDQTVESHGIEANIECVASIDDDAEEKPKDMKKKKKKRKTENCDEIEQHVESISVQSCESERKKKKRKKNREIDCAEIEKASDCIESMVSGANEDAPKSKKKRKKSKMLVS